MRPFLLPFKFTVSGLLIVVVFRNIDLDSLAERFAGQSRGWLIAAATVTIAQMLLAGLRWDQIIRGLRASVPLETVIRVTYIGTFFNSWLLGNIGGDVARAALAPEGGIGRIRIIYSVLFDRVTTLAGLGLVMLPVIALNADAPASGRLGCLRASQRSSPWAESSIRLTSPPTEDADYPFKMWQGKTWHSTF